MKRYLIVLLFACCAVSTTANAGEVFSTQESFQIAAAVKLGRTGVIDNTFSSGTSSVKYAPKKNGGQIGDTPTSCKAGYYISGRSCKKCPAGQYSDDGTVCKDCAAGYYNNKEGKSSCTACPAGKYAAGTGNTTCTDCPAGQYSTATGSTSCTSCAPGTYSSTAGRSTACDACPTGKYAAGTGNTFCEACPSGTYTNTTGTKSCTLCGPGTYNNKTGQTACTNCPQGMYADSRGNTVCTDCPKGTYASSTGQKTCTPCPAGKYVAGLGNLSCLTAPSGNYAAGTGNTDYTACPKGTYQSSTGKGYCDLCPAGKYQDETGKSSCKDCPEGQTSEGGALACAVAPMKVATIQDVSVGIFYTGMAASKEKFLEALGTPNSHLHCWGTNNIECMCYVYEDNGTPYFTFRHMSSCRTYAPHWNLDPELCEDFSAPQCTTRYPNGPYTIKWTDEATAAGLAGATGKTTTHYYQDTSDGTNTYPVVIVGLTDVAEFNDGSKYAKRVTTSQTPYGQIDLQCTLSADGTQGAFITEANCNAWKTHMGNGSCAKAPATVSKPSFGIRYTKECNYIWTGTAATSCPAGQYSASGKTPCRTCEGGYYCTGGSAHTGCPAGTYSNNGASQCTTCPAGYYCRGGTSGEACPAGTTSPAGATSSSQCVNNTKTVTITDPYGSTSTTTTQPNAAAYVASLSGNKTGFTCLDLSDGNISCGCSRNDRSLYFKTYNHCDQFKTVLGIPYSCTVNSGVCEATMNVNGAYFSRIAKDSVGNTSSKLSTSDDAIYGLYTKAKQKAYATCSTNSGLEITCTAGRGPNREYYFYDASKMANKMQELMQSGNTIVYYGTYQGGFFTYYIEPAY